MEIYSEFQNHYYFYDIKVKKGQWIKEKIYYRGDLSTVDFANDWRFQEVLGKRKQVIFLGLKEMEFKDIEIDWTKPPE